MVHREIATTFFFDVSLAFVLGLVEEMSMAVSVIRDIDDVFAIGVIVRCDPIAASRCPVVAVILLAIVFLVRWNLSSSPAIIVVRRTRFTISPLLT